MFLQHIAAGYPWATRRSPMCSAPSIACRRGGLVLLVEPADNIGGGTPGTPQMLGLLLLGWRQGIVAASPILGGRRTLFRRWPRRDRVAADRRQD